MRRALQVQGVAFAGLALLVALGTSVLPAVPRKAELLVVAVLIIVLGVPHGALDTVFARMRFSLGTWRAWLGFGLRYVGFMSVVFALWLLAPLVFLVAFLSLSAVHFSGDPVRGASLVARCVQGGAVLVLPALRHREELTVLFAMLVGEPAAGAVVPVLAAAAVPWTVAVGVGAIIAVTRSKQAALELVAVGVLAISAPPLLAFAVYFCAMHAARHILRTAAYAGITRWQTLATSAAVPMLVVSGAGIVGWSLHSQLQLEVRVIQLLFVGLASLTVPHMLLVEPVRQAGWADGP